MFHRRQADIYDSPKNKSPDSKSHGTRVEQPSHEVCSQPAYVLIRTLGMAPTCFCGRLENVECSLMVVIWGRFEVN